MESILIKWESAEDKQNRLGKCQIGVGKDEAPVQIWPVVPFQQNLRQNRNS